MAIKKCKVCGKANPIRADGICWNCYYRDYCAWSRGPEERISYKEAMIEKFKASIVRMRKDVTTLQKKRNKMMNNGKIPIFSFNGTGYQLTRHERAPKGYVWHHTYYDYNDPEAGIVLIERSKHTMGHAVLRKLGISIPRINFKK